MNKLFIFLIELYQKYISPILPPSCRFYPSCSEYSKQAFKEFNFFKALFLTIKRLIKCNPLHPGGFDPIKTSKMSRIKGEKD